MVKAGTDSATHAAATTHPGSKARANPMGLETGTAVTIALERRLRPRRSGSLRADLTTGEVVIKEGQGEAVTQEGVAVEEVVTAVAAATHEMLVTTHGAAEEVAEARELATATAVATEVEEEAIKETAEARPHLDIEALPLREDHLQPPHMAVRKEAMPHRALLVAAVIAVVRATANNPEPPHTGAARHLPHLAEAVISAVLVAAIEGADHPRCCVSAGATGGASALALQVCRSSLD